ncbi:MAG: methylenetetrahydrofolate reductase [Verrucomicrobiales bacterium]
MEELYHTIAELEPYKPSFVSVTYGAGGSTREATHDLVVRIKEEGALDPIPHLTCVCHQEGGGRRHPVALRGVVAVSNILALGGDPPRGMEGYDRRQDAFQHAADLVSFIQRFNASGEHPDPRGFGIGVLRLPEELTRRPRTACSKWTISKRRSMREPTTS